MTKKRINLLFLLAILIFFISIIVINYQVDPHRVFHSDGYMDMASVEPENILIKMKAYKNVPYDTVIIAFSFTFLQRLKIEVYLFSVCFILCMSGGFLIVYKYIKPKICFKF